MDNLYKQIGVTPEQIDIYVKRILAKFTSEEQILFSEPIVGIGPCPRKTPLSLCIYKKFADDTYYGVKCITEVKICEWSTCQEIICNHKARLRITFKVFLCVKYEDNTYGVVVLPDDNGIKFCFQENFPITIGKGETLAINNGYFVWSKDVPFTEFDRPLPPTIFDDPTLSSHLIVRAIRPEFDVLTDCFCESEGELIPGTQVLLALFADLLDKLGVEQDVLIQGIPLDD